MTPRQENTTLCSSSQQLPLTLEGVFELTQRPSRALDLPRALLPDTRTLLGVGHSICLSDMPNSFYNRQTEVQGPRHKLLADPNLDSAFVENALFYNDL